MRGRLATAGCVLFVVCLLSARDSRIDAACCYFSAVGQDVNQPAQKAFLTWDPEEGIESFTVQPKFEGNAIDFGMVIPTPSQPKLDEMPRDFFQALAVFTILKPMPIEKYKQQVYYRGMTLGAGNGAVERRSSVRVLEEGVVGSLDYKIVAAERADDLYTWLSENGYSYSGDEETLAFYVRKNWFFTTMKIDPKQMKKNPDGTYSGEVTPTRFTFESSEFVYPLRITQKSVRESTEALFYVLAPYKTDLAGTRSHKYQFAPMWAQAMDFAIPEKLTPEETRWRAHVAPLLEGLAAEFARHAEGNPGARATTLEWAKRLEASDLSVLGDPSLYDRDAPAEEAAKLKFLAGCLQEGLFLTKFRRVFAREEMTDDLVIVPAELGGEADSMPYFEILPTSPP